MERRYIVPAAEPFAPPQAPLTGASHPDLEMAHFVMARFAAAYFETACLEMARSELVRLAVARPAPKLSPKPPAGPSRREICQCVS